MKSQQVEPRVTQSEERELIWVFIVSLTALIIAVASSVRLSELHQSRYDLLPSNHQLFGLLSLSIFPVVFLILGLRTVRKGKLYVFGIQAAFLCLFSATALGAAAVLTLVDTPKYVDGGVGQLGGITSGYEAQLVLLVISCGVGILMYACVDLKIYRSMWKELAGICVVISILLPSVLESQKVNWAEWERLHRCPDGRYEGLRFAISLGEIALASSAAFVVVCGLSFILMHKFGNGFSNKIEIKKNSLWCEEA